MDDGDTSCDQCQGFGVVELPCARWHLGPDGEACTDATHFEPCQTQACVAARGRVEEAREVAAA